MDKNITPEFCRKAKISDRKSKHNPAIVEMVKLLARISAENDYDNHIKKHKKHSKNRKKGLENL